jgi:hypothetical protein
LIYAYLDESIFRNLCNGIFHLARAL